MRGALLIAICLLSWPSLVGAQPQEGSEPPAAEADKEGARELFAQGQEAQKAGDFAEAAKLYQRAYERYPLPVMLYNVAQAARLGGDLELALENYRAFLAAEPKGQAAEFARAFVKELEDKLAGKAQAEPEPGEPVPELEPDASEPVDPELLPIPGPIEPTDKVSSRLRWTGLAVAGVGVLSLGAGIGYAVQAGNRQDAAEAIRGPWTEQGTKLYEEGQRAQTRARVFAAVGAVGILAGGALYVLGRRTPGDTQIALSPDDRGAVFAVSGRF